MKKLLIALMTTTSAMSLAASAQAADKLKACWVYTGPIGDFGYSYQHDQGRLEVEKALGDKAETAYLENVSEGPDADRAFERLAREGAAEPVAQEAVERADAERPERRRGRAVARPLARDRRDPDADAAAVDRHRRGAPRRGGG